MSKLKIPKEYKSRLKEVARKHDFASGEAFADHLVDKGLNTYGVDKSLPMDEKLELVVEENGYSSKEELIEHLLERGLRAYEEPVDDPKKLEERLRGLGYIE